MARRRERPKGARLADGSTKDTVWQRAAYAEAMGEEKAYEQELAYRIENGLCTCPGWRGTTLKMRGMYRTVHKPECPKHKPWMVEVEAEYRQFYRR
jgi:hypothetical protein